MNRFTLDEGGRLSKRATLVDTESEFIAYVDIDDVPRDDVLNTAQAIVRTLNAHAAEIPA